MVPKIADFGLSSCLSEEQTRYITQNLWGTPGYVDPEYIRSRQISFSSDMYSLGVIIMEIVAGIRCYREDEDVISGKKPNHYDDSSHSLARRFVEVHKEGKKATHLFDMDIAVTAGDLEILGHLAEIAMECLNLDVDQRLTMTDVAERLLMLNRSRRPQAV